MHPCGKCGTVEMEGKVEKAKFVYVFLKVIKSDQYHEKIKAAWQA